ncbi:hypothetical protein LINGRAHAP2_LOCUS6404 [Linum grandiflorum]
MAAFSYSSSSSVPRITCRSHERIPPPQMLANFKGYISPPARGGALKHTILLRRRPAVATSYTRCAIVTILLSD